MPTHRPSFAPRSLLAAFALCMPALCLASPAQAAGTPPPDRQVAGYVHQQIGTRTVTALFDGLVPLPRGQLKDIAPARMDALLARGFVPEGKDGLQTAVNAYLVNDGRQLILVDTGTAQCFGPGLGRVLENLRASGYAPGQVDTVLLTHAHPDHLCGLLDAQGQAAYPNATVWLSQRDADYWLDPATETGADVPARYRPLFKMARDAVAPYRAAGRLHLFADGAPMPDGVRALASHGHTPGHTSYLFGDVADQQLLVWGDIVHYHAVQFADPSAAFEADADRVRATAARRDLMARSADQRWWLAGAHLPFPGIGHVRRDGKAFAWVPAEYAPLPDAPRAGDAPK